MEWITHMTNEQILAALVRPEAFPAEAIALADARRDEIAPLLIAEIEAWTDGRRADIRGNYFLADIACHLLAEWRDTRGFRPLLALLATPSHEVFGDSITEGMSSLLARLYDGDVAPLHSLVLNTAADQFVRDAALDAYVLLVQEGKIPLSEIHAFLLEVFARMPHTEDFAWNGWVGAVSSLVLDDLLPQVRQLFEEEAVSIGWMDYEDFEEDLEDARRAPPRHRQTAYESPVEAMRYWRYAVAGDDVDLDEDIEDMVADRFRSALDGMPALNPYRDVGRNDPCPCGSGKKFKKCCLEKAEIGFR